MAGTRTRMGSRMKIRRWRARQYLPNGVACSKLSKVILNTVTHLIFRY
jgi:hypothetical protein